jgi:hypothetical protein
MSDPAMDRFDVTLIQLSADGKAAGAGLPTVERPGLTAKELRKLLSAVAKVAPQVAYPAAPSLRVQGPTGQSIINLKDGRLQFVSWSSRLAPGANPTADDIYRAITGEEVEGIPAATPVSRGHPGTSSRLKRGLLIAACLAVIIGLNTFTLTRDREPMGSLLPEFRVLPPEPAERLLATAAGTYETGTRPGDRRLEISRSGQVQWIKYGTDRSPVERREMTVQAVTSGGKEALLTSRKAIVHIKDPMTVTYFGDAYTRLKQ